MDKFFRKFCEFLVTYKKSVLVIMALATVFFLWQAINIRMFTQFLDLFPNKHPYVKIHKEYSRFFGGAYQATLMLEVKNGNVYNLDTINKMARIQDAVDLIPGVDHFSINSIASLMVAVVKETPDGIQIRQLMKDVPTDQAGINELRRKVATSGNINGVYVSRDEKALRLTANFNEGIIDFKTLYKKFMEIKAKEEDANHMIRLSGTPLLYGWVYHYLPHMVVILIITSLVILAMLYGYMSTGGMWWWPFVGAVVCSIWGLGISACLGFHFDPLIIVIPFLLSARAMSHGVQWVERFVEEYRRTQDIKESAIVTGASLFPPGLIGIVADTWALLIIAITPIPTLRNLAFLGTFWAAASIFTILVLFPPLFASFKRVHVPMKSDVPATTSYKIEYFTEHVLRRILIKMSSWTFGRGRWVTLCVSVVILIVSVICSMQLKYGDANPGSPILWKSSLYNTDVDQINKRFPGVDEMWIVIEGKDANAASRPDVVLGMEELQQYMMKDPNVGYAGSIADMVKVFSMLIRGNDPKEEAIPRDKVACGQIIQFISYGSPPGGFDFFMSPDFESANVRLSLKNHEGEVLKEVITKVENFIKDHPNLMENAKAKPAGGIGGILAAANEVIAKRNHPILLFILAVIFVHCALTYQSVLAGVVFTVSLVLANFIAFAYMVFMNIGLNINTFPVVSLGIGLGVDYGLYIVSRIIEVYRDQEVKDLGEAVKGGMTTAGRAVFFTATMMSAGVLVWVFSPLRFQAEMGLLLGILMMVNMVVGVLVLPAVINIIRPKFILGSTAKGEVR